MPNKSTTSYAIKIVVAFFLSSVLHAFSLPQDVPELSVLKYGGFFWIHGLCVSFEILVAILMNYTEPPKRISIWQIRSRMVVNAAWTLAVLYHTVPMVGSELVKVMVAVKMRPVL